MTNRIFAGSIIVLMFFCLCVENKENAGNTITTQATANEQVTSTTVSGASAADKCTIFSCGGNLDTKSEDGGSNIAYCDGMEVARITCKEDEGANIVTGDSMTVYSMCCVEYGSDPLMPSCDRCDDGTACGSRTGQMKCSCEDENKDGKYESCILWPAGCDRCSNGILCGQVNDKKETCKCEGSASPAADTGEYASCELVQTCDRCEDATACGEKNDKAETCECSPAAGLHETCELRKQLTCDANCRQIGYVSGYCGKWVENTDNTITECTTGEYPFYANYHQGASLMDCEDNSAPGARNKTICCCKGEPQNSDKCPVVKRPSNPMDCIETPGYLKDPKTGECCWYRATCYGPDNWQEYQTKEECLDPNA